MKRFAGIVFWTLIFLALLLAIDQLFVRVPLEVRGLREVRTFYIDVRSRLISIRKVVPPSREGQEPAGKSGKAEKATKPPVKRDTRPETRETSAVSPKESPHFVYTDEGGNLQFAASLDEIPAKLRRDAKRLEP